MSSRGGNPDAVCVERVTQCAREGCGILAIAMQAQGVSA